MNDANMRGHWRTFGLAVAILPGVIASGCRDRQPDVCRIDYELVGGQPSERFDVLEVDTSRNLVVRAAYPDGEALSEAIYYYFDDAGRMRLEALDRRANSDIEARVDAQDPIFDVLVPYAVDMNLQDGAIDTAQYSLLVPTSLIGPWNPARIFYQLPCDQSPVSVQGGGTAERTIVFEAELPAGAEGSGASDGSGANDGSGASEGSTGTPDTGARPPGTRTIMKLRFDEAGRPIEWLIDTNDDGIPNDVASLIYNELGLISELYWTRPGRFFGQIYARGRWTYDTNGHLYTFELDADGDEVYESRAVYGEACFEGGAP